MLKFAALLSLTFLIPAFVDAQASLYGQCGGTGFSEYNQLPVQEFDLNWVLDGPTTCVSGATCVYSNPYYSQCL